MPSHIEKMDTKAVSKSFGGVMFDAVKKALGVNESRLSDIEKNTSQLMKANKASGEAKVEAARAEKIRVKNDEKQNKFFEFMKQKWSDTKENEKIQKTGNFLGKLFRGLLAGLVLFSLPQGFWTGIGDALKSLYNWAIKFEWKEFFKDTFGKIKTVVETVSGMINRFITTIWGKEGKGGILGEGGGVSWILQNVFGMNEKDANELTKNISGFSAGLAGAIGLLTLAFPGTTMTALGKGISLLSGFGWKALKGSLSLFGDGIKLMGSQMGVPGFGAGGMLGDKPKNWDKMTDEQKQKFKEGAAKNKKTAQATSKQAKGKTLNKKPGGGGWFKKLIGKLGKFGQTIMKLGGSVVRGLVTMGPWGWGILLAAAAGLLIYSYWDEISTGFSNMGKSIKEGIDSLISKFKSFDIMKSMEGFIRKVPGFGNLIADAMFGTKAEQEAAKQAEREKGYGKEFVHKTPEERKQIEKEERAQEDKKKTTSGATTAVAKGDVKGIEAEIEALNNEWSTLGTTQVDKQRAAEIGKKVKALRSKKMAILDSQSKKATPVKSGGGSAIRKINPKSLGIDWDFISKKEGGSALKGYVPDPDGSKSGVTIATGFDLGARNIKDLEGLPQDLQSKLAPYLGLQGQNAAAMLRQRPLEITAKEAKQIDKMSKGAAVNKLQREWNKRAEETGGKRFEDLSSAQQTVAASVAFQYGSLSKTPNFRKAMQSGDWTKAINELNNFGDSYSTRRKSEAQYLMASLDPNKKSQAMNQLQTANAEARMGGRNGTTVVAPTITKVNNSSSQGLIMPARAQDTRWDRKV